MFLRSSFLLIRIIPSMYFLIYVNNFFLTYLVSWGSSSMLIILLISSVWSFYMKVIFTCLLYQNFNYQEMIKCWNSKKAACPTLIVVLLIYQHVGDNFCKQLLYLWQHLIDSHLGFLSMAGLFLDSPITSPMTIFPSPGAPPLFVHSIAKVNTR